MAKFFRADHHFEEWSETYEDSPMQRLIFDRVHRAVLARVPEGLRPSSILDIGCGTGRLLRKAGARWPEAALFGVDLSEGMIAQARARTPGATFTVGAAETLPAPDASVDLALSTASFHHWQDQAAGLRQVARVLRPGGVFVLGDLVFPFHGKPIRPWALGRMYADAGLALCSQQWLWISFFVAAVGEKD
jgi:ubiquinone/menaquinone biosynthesis C-methylase UbiE